MLRLATLFLVLLVLGLHFPAGAKEMAWQGTISFELGPYDPIHIQGSGVATLSTDASGTQLQGLRLNGGITGVATIPTATGGGLIDSIRISPRLGTGTLGPFFPITPTGPQLVQKALPMRGQARFCLLRSGCSIAVPLPFSKAAGQSAIGVGGTLTAGGYGSVRISIAAAPWALFTATQQAGTPYGGTVIQSRTGWIHGAGSLTFSSAAVTGAALQLVTPLEINSIGEIPINTQGFAYLTLRFIPEPGFILLLGAGLLGLIILGHKRIRK
jgi:hypothetical protein